MLGFQLKTALETKPEDQLGASPFCGAQWHGAILDTPQQIHNR